MRQCVERGGDRASSSSPVAIEQHCLVPPFEQRASDEALERLDPAAERWRRQRQFLGRRL
jgi:hypothetical protein